LIINDTAAFSRSFLALSRCQIEGELVNACEERLAGGLGLSDC
jgi:hypothetical protein